MWIELKDNLINNFDDLADLGLLKKLCILNFENCPITKKGDRHIIPQLSILKMVMYNDKYSKYCMVKVACANYGV